MQDIIWNSLIYDVHWLDTATPHWVINYINASVRNLYDVVTYASF